MAYEPATTTQTTDIPPTTSTTPAAPYQLAIAPSGTGYAVTIDGHDIAPALTGVTLAMSAAQIPQATLELRIGTADVHPIEAGVTIPEETAAALQALGWAPPATDQTTEV